MTHQICILIGLGNGAIHRSYVIEEGSHLRIWDPSAVDTRQGQLGVHFIYLLAGIDPPISIIKSLQILVTFTLKYHRISTHFRKKIAQDLVLKIVSVVSP